MLLVILKVQDLDVLVLTVTSALVTASEKVTVRGITSPCLYLPLAVVLVTELITGSSVSREIKFQVVVSLMPAYALPALSVSAVASICT